MVCNSKWFDPKDPADTETYTFGFDADLDTGETILTSTWTISVFEGVDSSPSTMLFGAPAVSGGKVSHFIQGGIIGNTYLLKCQVQTSGGQSISLAGYVPIRSAASSDCC